jgi:hypothetical protein
MVAVATRRSLFLGVRRIGILLCYAPYRTDIFHFFLSFLQSKVESPAPRLINPQ